MVAGAGRRRGKLRFFRTVAGVLLGGGRMLWHGILHCTAPSVAYCTSVHEHSAWHISDAEGYPSSTGQSQDGAVAICPPIYLVWASGNVVGRSVWHLIQSMDFSIRCCLFWACCALLPHPTCRLAWSQSTDRAGCGLLLTPALLTLSPTYKIYRAATTAMACKNA